MLTKIKNILFSKSKYKLFEEIEEEAYEIDRQNNPQKYRQITLITASHSYKQGMSVEIMRVVYGKDIAEEVLKNCNIKVCKQDLL